MAMPHFHKLSPSLPKPSWLDHLPRISPKSPRSFTNSGPNPNFQPNLMHGPQIVERRTQIGKHFSQPLGCPPPPFPSSMYAHWTMHREWVLWNVNDSLELVEDFVPWFLPTYHKLDEENVVYRADILRNMFMHIFGGVYADLDTDCLQGWDSLIKEYREPGYRQVYTARMGTNDAHSNSIPNAWMASTPGHPFWLLPLEYLEKHMGGDQQPEAITGPGALKACIDDEYLKKYRWDDKALDLHYAASGWRSLFQIDPALQNSSEDTQKTTVQTSAQTLTILPQWEVFPYAWTEDGISVRPWCSTQKETFNATRCKELLAVEAWGSHAISYFSHSWGGESDMDKVGMTEEEKEAEKKTKEGVEKEDERSKKMGVSFKDASGRASQEKNDVLTATAASTSGSSLTSASIPTAMLPTPGFDYEEDD